MNAKLKIFEEPAMREPGIYKDVEMEFYHTEEGISSSGISLILDCPKRYWYEYMADKPVEEESRKFMLGRAVHMKVLEPHRFDEEFYVMPKKLDLRTIKGKEENEKFMTEANGRNILKLDEFETINQLSAEVLKHSIWNKIPLNEGCVEHSIYWDAGIYNTRLRARPDFFNENIIVDIKTTDSIASFRRSVYNFGYHRQAAMQIDGLKAIDGKTRLFAFFVVEKDAPYLTACFTLDEQTIEQGRKEYLEGAQIYSECLKYNTWPGYEEKTQLLSLPKWLTQNSEEII